jgi:hypothetical protein
MSCSGQRNRAAYVPPNAYTPGKLMDDYAFLEEISRRSAEWGQEVAPEVKREKERPGSKLPVTLDLNKRESELGRIARKAEVQLMRMPRGMEKRKLNRTRWDPKRVMMLFHVRTNHHLIGLLTELKRYGGQSSL